MKIELSRDWTEFLSALIARRVRFVLVGGHAVAGHGEPRLTEDLDVFVEPTIANARRLYSALEDFGFGAVAPSLEELATPDKIFMLGRKPWRIDILTGIDGVTFREAWASKVEAEFAVRALYVIGREALIKNKREAARDKDLLASAHAFLREAPGGIGGEHDLVRVQVEGRDLQPPVEPRDLQRAEALALRGEPLLEPRAAVDVRVAEEVTAEPRADLHERIGLHLTHAGLRCQRKKSEQCPYLA